MGTIRVPAWLTDWALSDPRGPEPSHQSAPRPGAARAFSSSNRSHGRHSLGVRGRGRPCDEWRFEPDLPDLVPRLARAAGLDHQELTAKSFSLSPIRPAHVLAFLQNGSGFARAHPWGARGKSAFWGIISRENRLPKQLS
jgi:hypothetical protein